LFSLHSVALALFKENVPLSYPQHWRSEGSLDVGQHYRNYSETENYRRVAKEIPRIIHMGWRRSSGLADFDVEELDIALRLPV